MHTEKTKKITFDRKEAALKLGISVVTLDRELAKGKMPHFRVGRRVLFTQELLEKYIEQNTQDARTRRSRNLR
ncbi:MAG: helix-turn-helix domain-containing protein [Pyrinomonadaceae bacterium]